MDELEAPEFRIDVLTPHLTEVLWEHGEWSREVESAEDGYFPLGHRNGTSCRSGRLVGGVGSLAYGNANGTVKDDGDAVWKIVRSESHESNDFSDGPNGCYLTSWLKADPMVVQWDVMLGAKPSSGTNTSYYKGAHMRFGGTTSADKVSSTIADVYFDDDGYIKLDNGYGTSPEVGPAYTLGMWYKMRLYVDWSTVPAGLALMVDDGSGEGFVHAATNEAYCSYCR